MSSISYYIPLTFYPCFKYSLNLLIIYIVAYIIPSLCVISGGLWEGVGVPLCLSVPSEINVNFNTNHIRATRQDYE